IGESAGKVMDLAVFFGEHATLAAAAAVQAGMRPENVHTFASQREAGEFLRTELSRGDLVLLRPSMTDKPERIYYAQFGSVGCTRLVCPMVHLCDARPELRPGLERISEVPPGDGPNWHPQGSRL